MKPGHRRVTGPAKKGRPFLAALFAQEVAGGVQGHEHGTLPERLLELRRPSLARLDGAVLQKSDLGFVAERVPGAAHVLPLEKPDEFNRILLEFLAVDFSQ